MALTYSAVVPAYNAEATLDQCLEALANAVPAPQSIIVFDDGSTDETGGIAQRHGAHVIRNDDRPLGPAKGRNRGAAGIEDDLVLFVDSDVVIDREAPARLIDALTQDENIAAAFGSYGTRQVAGNLTARYANLRHHHFHQTGNREAETFWTGLGVVRAAVFKTVGGFDNEILRPAMEDIELGGRIRSLGYTIRLVPEAQGTHLKNWTLHQLWRDDVFTRAIPWSGMILSGKCKASLNASLGEKLIAVIAHLIWVSALIAVLEPNALILTGVLAVIYTAANMRFLSVLFRHGGILAGIAGTGLHWCYHLYSSAIFGSMLILTKLRSLGFTHKQRGAQLSGKRT